MSKDQASAPAAFTSEGLLRVLQRHKLLSLDALTTIETDILPQVETVTAFARRLIDDQYLTEFQCKLILRGKAKSLRIGSYVVQERIGAGGMGEVFRAWHPKLKRSAAIKTLPGQMMRDRETILRFHREAEAAAQLQHPNIVMTHDADETRGIHYLVMEFVDGLDLAALVRQSGPLPVPQAISCLHQAAKGLAYAHEQGVIHRDIKPQNLLLDNNGVVKILDMGLARVQEQSGQTQTQPLTVTGTIMGTPDFMSPEQALDTRQADARSDIYSLGCTLYFLLGGKPVYPMETAMQKLLAHRDEPVPALPTANTTVPNRLNLVFQKMVAKLPEERYQSMYEVLTALESCDLLEADVTNLVVPPRTSLEYAGSLPTTIVRDIQASGPGTQQNFDAVEETFVTTSVLPPPEPARRTGLWLGGLAVLVLLAVGLVLNLKTPRRHRRAGNRRSERSRVGRYD